MTTSTIYLIYAVIGVLALGAVLFAIINWIKLAKTSSAINALQVEIDKKTREFDAIKKENEQLKNLIPAQNGTEDSAGGKQAPKIEIVRNIRSGFEDTAEQATPAPAPHFAGEQSGPEVIESQNVPVEPPPETMSDSTVQETAAAEENGSVEDGAIIFSTVKSDENVLDVVGEEKAESSVETTEAESITIPLYSESVKYADFENLWNTLSQALESPQQQHVYIDLTSIPSFNNEEIAYLQKICQIVKHKNGSVAFINYNNDLGTLLSQDSTLSSFIGKD